MSSTAPSLSNQVSARLYPLSVFPQRIPERMLTYIQRLGLSELEQARLLRELRKEGLPAEPTLLWARLETLLGKEAPAGMEWQGRLPGVYRTNPAAAASLLKQKPIHRTSMYSRPFNRFQAENWLRRLLGLSPRGSYSIASRNRFDKGRTELATGQ